MDNERKTFLNEMYGGSKIEPPPNDRFPVEQYKAHTKPSDETPKPKVEHKPAFDQHMKRVSGDTHKQEIDDLKEKVSRLSRSLNNLIGESKVLRQKNALLEKQVHYLNNQMNGIDRNTQLLHRNLSENTRLLDEIRFNDKLFKKP